MGPGPGLSAGPGSILRRVTPGRADGSGAGAPVSGAGPAGPSGEPDEICPTPVHGSGKPGDPRRPVFFELFRLYSPDKKENEKNKKY